MPVELTPEEDAVLTEATEKWAVAEDKHKSYRDQWDHRYRQYRSYQDFASAARDAPDRDVVIREGQSEWGPELFIPYCFTVVETILPRVLSNRPRMLVLPRSQASEQNVENMKFLIDSQQERIRYELTLQETAKSGLIYGLGAQKTRWRKEEITRPKLMTGTTVEWAVGEETVVLFDDPDAEDIDIFDLRWDPYGYSAETLDWVFHRTWRSNKYVLEKVRSGAWRHMEDEDVTSMGPEGSRYDDTMSERMQAAGHKDFKSRDNQLHEVWELWTREGQVITILDSKVPVSVGHNPYWHGELPFQFFRPTTSGLKQLPGIGEIEPIEHLQREMNTLRSQRRANAALKLQQVFAYADGLVEPGDLQFFPGSAIAVAGEPRDLLFPINVGDIPNSGYQEESNLQADIERVTGISDPVTGASDASQTATGVQLVQAAANVRIQSKTRRLEVEVVKAACRQFGALNQQKIRENREVRIPAPPEPGKADQRWAWRQLGPGELAGEFDYEPEGGSTAPDNVPQMRQDAQALMLTFGQDPEVDRRRVLEQSLRLFGVRNPESWLRPEQHIPPVILDILAQNGVDPNLIAQAFEAAITQEQQQAAQSPNLPSAQEEESQGQGGVQGGSRNGSEPAKATA